TRSSSFMCFHVWGRRQRHLNNHITSVQLASVWLSVDDEEKIFRSAQAGVRVSTAGGTDSEIKISGGRMPDGKIGAFTKFGNFAGQDSSYAAVDDESQRSRFGQPVGHAGEFLVLKRNDDLLTARIGRKPAPAVDDRRRGAAQPEFIPLRDLSEQSVAKLFDDDLFAGLHCERGRRFAQFGRERSMIEIDSDAEDEPQ